MIYDSIRILKCGCIQTTSHDEILTLRFKCKVHKKNGYLTKNWHEGIIVFQMEFKLK